MNFWPYANSGYCLHIDESVVQSLNLTIKNLIDWCNEYGDREKEIKEIGECTEFMSALKKAIYHFGTGIEAKIKIGEDVVSAVIYEYDPDMGGVDDCLIKGPYFDFSEEQLYDIKPLPVLGQLRAVGCEPCFSTWVTT